MADDNQFIRQSNLDCGNPEESVDAMDDSKRDDGFYKTYSRDL